MIQGCHGSLGVVLNSVKSQVGFYLLACFGCEFVVKAGGWLSCRPWTSFHPMLQKFISQSCYKYGRECTHSNEEGCLQRWYLEGPHIHSGDAVTAGHRVGTPPWDLGSSGIHSQVYQLVFVKHVQFARHRGWPSQGKRQLLPSRHMPVKE